jgi:transcription antitermination factor NusG
MWKSTLLSEDGEALSHGDEIFGSAASSTVSDLAHLAPDSSFKWFAVYTTPRHEKAVARQFESRHIEAFLPLYTTPSRWKNSCRVRVDRPLFPSYLFVHIERRDCVRVLQVPGVLSIIGSGREPSALPNSDIESLRSSLLIRQFEPHQYLVAGEKVRIHSGSLTGMVGVLVRRKNSLRVVLTLDLIMQSVAVEVGTDEIEPLDPYHRH